MSKQLNVRGTELKPCSFNPLTGFNRTGYCNSSDSDVGKHFVCAQVTNRFLIFTKSRGNDLISSLGLKEGDFWCICVSRWLEAYNYNPKIAPKIDLEKTNKAVLKYIPLYILDSYKL